MKRVCVDMDEVMADTLAEHLRRYNQAFEEDVTVDDLAGKGLWEITPQDRQKELRAFLDAEDFFEDLAPDAGFAGGSETAFVALRDLYRHAGHGGAQLAWAQSIAGCSATSRSFRPRIMSSAETRAFCAPIT